MPPYEYPPEPRPPISREQIAHALQLWRDGQHHVERRLRADWRADYEQAIAADVAFLRRYTTMQELVRSYFDDVTDESGHDPFEQAVHDLPSGHILTYGVVEDASYFRRARELIAHAGSTSPPESPS